MRFALGCVFSVLLAFAQNDPSTGSLSTRRRALLIGNSAYQHLPELRTPKANVEALAAALGALQIPLEVAYDLTQVGLLSILQKFATCSLATSYWFIFRGMVTSKVKSTTFCP